ncbi:hypothetical protein WQE_05142 [Paraburkholderia hospita]|uniref:Uncharacterized protein n=1 Tax=Paraburkholderia hospita TaxID=169430 RepID=A0ABN0FTM8_9BURK|nr:hypothetical protein [Paraburkholderia hospita]EIN02193.1 hypothetical protein WQE_05142 [Paraburkholderia hospita]OUL90153.1 hypothetical protein CA602_07285 [Paraburkholderia hospita]
MEIWYPTIEDQIGQTPLTGIRRLGPILSYGTVDAETAGISWRFRLVQALADAQHVLMDPLSQ